jgi:diguanylate cyclase (GGDEF)-like protein
VTRIARPSFRSAGRVAAAGLVLAAAMIVALGWLVLADLQREAELHREATAAQEVKDALQDVRLQLVELRHAASALAVSGDAAEKRIIERRSMELDRDLGRLERSLGGPGAALPGFAEMNDAARHLLLHARSIEATRQALGAAAAIAAAQRADAVGEEALREQARAVQSQDARIRERIAARLRIAEGLDRYLRWLLAGAAIVLLGLVASYRLARRNEAAALRNLERLALWDSVTGLPNRTFLLDRLGEEIARAQRHGRRFALLMFDLDGFKAVNDTHGHAAGDRVLAAVGSRAARSMRVSDVVGRIGGDEFMALLPEASADGAAAVAEKLRIALAQPYPLGRITARLSGSIGIAFFPDHGRDAEALQRAADDALYRAKGAGRNRALVAEGAPAPAAVETAA